MCSTITNRIKRRTVRGYQPFGQCVYTYIYVYIRKTWARWQKTGSLRTYVYSVVQFRLRPTAMTSMGCHASLLLFCRILMEARLINELVVEGTRKDSRGGGISPPSFFLDSPRSVAIASGFFKGKSPVVGCLRFCPNCFFFFFLINYKLLSFDKLSIFENSFRIKILSFNNIPIISYYSFHSLYFKLITFRSDRRNSTRDSFSFFLAV